ncbi:beta-glucosidase [Herbihabitans rhizosphaerae]|uniref:Beta-glucosidase n=1 Tax=Herbihabitans rhizosphaerae TaxID=1872711 RepID=A0A4Q7L654_9PSEU|nr:GH1 family beta-glucosidase [Herbihabitans rhizosphaerae]RZS44726.1 beta-glucosidase [Herbihabitans rhizosphaerae]
MPLPNGFRWGVGASGFQTEGALDADGRGRSTWDVFCAEPGRIAGGDSPAVAADFYHRYATDIALVRDLGVDLYRFSVAWPRVQPSGSGAVNAKGLDFYDRVVDEMCAAGLRPVPTLYHWDTPLPIEEDGGWLNRDTAFRFAEYAAIVGERLADRAEMWIPLNEPSVLTFLGYATGEYAPGKRLLFDSLPTAHHQLLAHGLAVRALRAAGATGIGTANAHAPTWPGSDSEADRGAAEFYDVLANWLWSDPILRGRYPDEDLATVMPGPVADDLEIIATPLDWYGVNYYSPFRVSAASGEEIPFVPTEIDGPKTGLGGEINPAGLGEILRAFPKRYGDALPPLYVSENGTSLSTVEEPDADDRVRDQGRIDYLDAHIAAMREAIEDGVDVRGYLHWSPTDNFEWTFGYAQRFGLVHVDYRTQKRTPKDSYHWFRELIKASR